MTTEQDECTACWSYADELAEVRGQLKEAAELLRDASAAIRCLDLALHAEFDYNTEYHPHPACKVIDSWLERCYDP